MTGKNCTICEKLNIKPFTKENIIGHYIPLHGAISYGALAVDIMNPSLIPGPVPKKILTNVLLLSTLCSSGVYVYGRPHLQKLPQSSRVKYAILGGSLFSLASVLTWALLKSVCFPNNSTLSTLAGLGAGAVILKVSTDYFHDCDKAIAQE